MNDRGSRNRLSLAVRDTMLSSNPLEAARTIRNAVDVAVAQLPPRGVARDGSTRRAVPGELCSCGRQARDVISTERFGDVGVCHVDGARPVPGVGRILGTFAGDARLVAS